VRWLHIKLLLLLLLLLILLSSFTWAWNKQRHCCWSATAALCCTPDMVSQLVYSG